MVRSTREMRRHPRFGDRIGFTIQHTTDPFKREWRALKRKIGARQARRHPHLGCRSYSLRG